MLLYYKQEQSVYYHSQGNYPHKYVTPPVAVSVTDSPGHTLILVEERLAIGETSLISVNSTVLLQNPPSETTTYKI